MFDTAGAFAVRDTEAARTFHGQTHGLAVGPVEGMKDLLQIDLGGGAGHLDAPTPTTDSPCSPCSATTPSPRSMSSPFEEHRPCARTGPHRTSAVTEDEPRTTWFADPPGNVCSVIREA